MLSQTFFDKVGILLLFFTVLFVGKAFASEQIPSGQLPDNVTPTHYQLSLTIDPSRENFSGKARIDIKINEPSDFFYLNAKALKIQSVSLLSTQEQAFDASAKYTDVDGVIKVSTDEILPTGKYSVVFEYDAPFNENLEGLHRVKDREQYYAFTQMEAISARLAFPSFDEPRFKTTFDVEMIIPEQLIAISNSPELASIKLSNGLKKVTFKTTKLLPTYLIAFFVGDFDVVVMPDMAPTKLRDYAVPLRGIAAKGKGEQLAYALSQTQQVTEALETYFQYPYPYRKLDVLAVPDFAAGAMENAGAITYREQLLLLDEKSSIGQKRLSLSVQAHELAHQWFGNLVTPVWWNDIWLNEAFATWMAATILEREFPGEQWQREQISSSKSAMNSDSIPSARKVRNLIETNSDIITAFDAITYQKGAGVLFMIENFMGKEKFREGVQAYMKKYQWGNTTAIDFFETIASVLPPQKAEEVIKSFRHFVEQAGVPNLTIKQSCETSNAVLSVSQERYSPLGTQFKENNLWNIPVCMSYEVEGKITQQCNVLAKQSQKITLAGAKCNTWVMPNAKAAGYYRFNFDSAGWQALLTNLHKVDPLEANAVIDSMKSAFNSGNLTVQDVIDVIPATLDASSWEVITSGMSTLRTVIKYADEDQKPALRKLAGDFYRAKADEIGFVDTTELDKSAPLDANELRTHLMSFMAFTARDNVYRKYLTHMGKDYIGYQTDGKFHDDAVIPALRSTAMSVAVQELGKDYVDALMVHLNASSDGTVRQRLIKGLTATKDLNISQTLVDFSLTSNVRDNEKTRFMFGLIRKKELDGVMWPWLTANFDALIAGLPTNYQSYIPYLFLGECVEEKNKRLDTFLKPRLGDLVGADRNFVKAKDHLKQCLAQKEKLKPQINELVLTLK